MLIKQMKNRIIKVKNFLTKHWVFVFCFLLIIYTLNADAAVWQPSAGHQQIPIWPQGKMPDSSPISKSESLIGSRDLVAGKPIMTVLDVTQPTMTLYSPKNKNTGAAILVFPGGGFHGLAMDLEGTEICEWLASQGINCPLFRTHEDGRKII